MAAISRRGRADVYIIICVRASRCGECALNPPTSQPIPRRRPSPAPAQRHAPPEHSRSPTQRRYTPADYAMHSSPTSPPIPRRRPPLAPTQRRRPSRALLLPHAAPTHAHRLRDARPPTSQHSPPRIFALPEHFLTPFPHTSAPPPRDDARPPPSPPIPRQKPSPVPAQRHALPAHFRSPTQAAPCIPRRPHNPFPAEGRRPSSQRHAASPSVPLRAQKKTAPHSGCAMPNVSVDRRCGRSLGVVSRALFAAVAGRWRVGVELRPQPWALRSRRCGRVLRA